MAWVSETTTSNFNAESYTTNQMAGRDGTRSLAANANSNGRSQPPVYRPYSIVGMDVTKVGPARDAIDQYVSRIESHLDGIQARAEADRAFKSEEVQAAVETYINKVKEYCINLCSQLRAFADKLSDAQKSWESTASKMAGTINEGASSFDAGSRYTL